MMTKIVVLGASGQLGNAIFKHLSAFHPFSVIGTSRRYQNKNGLVRFNPFKDDWLLLGKVDVVINCIGVIKPSLNNGYYKVHCELVSILIKNRKALGNPMIVQLSALGASDKHSIPFLKTKGIADRLLLSEPKVCTPNTMLVKKLKMVKVLLRIYNNLLFVPKGMLDYKIQPVLVDDLLEVIYKVIYFRLPVNIINVVGKEAISYRDLFSKYCSQKPIRFKEVSRKITDYLITNFVDPFLPFVINAEQYQLLFANNTADESFVENILDRPVASTNAFWQQQLLKL